MKQFQYKICHGQGLHARVAVSMAKLCREYESRILIEMKKASGDGKEVFSIMNLKAVHGDVLSFFIEGEDEEEAAAQLTVWCGQYL